MANKRAWRNRSKRAFTLLEILVVVGICAFVAAGIGVGVTQAISDSKGKECAANLATIEGAKDEFGGFCLTPRKGIVGHHAARVISQSMGIPASP